MNAPSPLTFGFTGAYRPIWIIYTMIFSVSLIAVLANGLGFNAWMKFSMGGIALVFALFKFFSLAAFARDFAKYDMIAKRRPAYATAYPFIEAGLGVLFLANLLVPLALFASIFVFGVGLIGVWQALQSDEKIQCACVGKMFDLPRLR